MQMERVRAANAERGRKRTGVREDEVCEERQEPGAGSRKQEAGSSEANRECGARCPEPGAPSSELCEEPCALSSEPCGETTDRLDPRYEETREEGFLAAQAEPLDERMEEELAVGVR
jgi:hypothetical protein